ncbi:hypothetical protein [Wolbachia endosymbiont (group A) of Aleiodes leptofemur]
MLLACYSHKHISYRIRTIIRKAIGSLIAHKSTIIFTQIKTAYLLHNPW